VIYYGFIDIKEGTFFFAVSFVCSFLIAFILRKIVEKTGSDNN